MAKYSYEDIFTQDVVSQWHEWLQEGKTLTWIAGNNGIQRTSIGTVQKYLAKFGYPTSTEEAQAQLEEVGQVDEHQEDDEEAEPAYERDADAGDPAKTYDLQPQANGKMPVSGSLPAVIDQLQALRNALGAAGAEVSVKAQIDLQIRMRIGEVDHG